MVSFYRPTPERHRILIEEAAFPSDRYAVASQVKFHGYDPDEGVIAVRPRTGEESIRDDDLDAALDEHGDSIALVLLGGVQYYTGQLFDLGRVAAKARAKGCVVGFDLAHAAGNVPLKLHEWNVDFAAWCTYKYLNSGPGSVAGAFVHARHAHDDSLPRFAGWWGNDPATRFSIPKTFTPRAGADGWQLSNPPILAMAPLVASLEIFSEVGMEALRTKSLALTGYLESLLDAIPGDRFEVITPREPERRGCQLSILVRENARALHTALGEAGVVCDYREPDVIRVAPVPLYNTFHDAWRFVSILTEGGS
jgi:kynureninase